MIRAYGRKRCIPEPHAKYENVCHRLTIEVMMQL